eukprot:366026-Chlamydomonas_euryale.AAC.19
MAKGRQQEKAAAAPRSPHPTGERMREPTPPRLNAVALALALLNRRRVAAARGTAAGRGVAPRRVVAVAGAHLR